MCLLSQNADNAGNARLFQFHHVEKHKACMVVLYLFRQHFEVVFQIEVDGRERGINSQIAERRIIWIPIKHVFKKIHQVCPYISTLVF